MKRILVLLVMLGLLAGSFAGLGQISVAAKPKPAAVEKAQPGDFGSVLKQAVRKEVGRKDGTIKLREAGKILRLIRRADRGNAKAKAALAEVERAVAVQAVEDGKCKSIEVAERDWQGFLDFIRELLQMIMELIAIFGV